MLTETKTPGGGDADGYQWLGRDGGNVAAGTDMSFGEVRRLTVRCVSETGWFDSGVLWEDIRRAGGAWVNQYDIAYSQGNAAGYCALLELEALDGTTTRYLLDAGWSTEWMDQAFCKSGVDALLKHRGIRAMILSHDHNDHFFGIESVLRYCPDITLYHPCTVMDRSLRLLDGEIVSSAPGAPVNSVPHVGERIPLEFGRVYVPQPGFCVVPFDVTVPLGVRGESVVYVKVRDKGYVVVTGCGHPGIGPILAYCQDRFAEGRTLYGCYGGLHIAPFEIWNDEMEESIRILRDAGLRKIACNHCTGRVWAARALADGLPVVRGTDAFRSYSRFVASVADDLDHVYVGNGDSVSF